MDKREIFISEEAFGLFLELCKKVLYICGTEINAKSFFSRALALAICQCINDILTFDDEPFQYIDQAGHVKIIEIDDDLRAELKSLMFRAHMYACNS